jgi:hypothetical protein
MPAKQQIPTRSECRRLHRGKSVPFKTLSRAPGGKLTEKLLAQFLARQVEISSHVAEDFGKGANFELLVGRDRDVMFRTFEFRCDSNVAASLASGFIPELAQSANKVFAAQVAGKLQAGMTSSLTMWRRMTLGFCPFSKWQETASRIMVFNSSRVSASVKMEKPRARAW